MQWLSLFCSLLFLTWSWRSVLQIQQFAIEHDFKMLAHFRVQVGKQKQVLLDVGAEGGGALKSTKGAEKEGKADGGDGDGDKSGSDEEEESEQEQSEDDGGAGR